MSPYRVDARLSGRHPFEIYVLVLCLLVSLPILLGRPATPGSVAALLPEPYAFFWSVVLAVGSAASLVGIYFKDRAKGLIIEQLGLAFVGVACVIYSGAILLSIGPLDGSVAAAIVGGFGFSCVRRYFQIQKVINDVHAIEKAARGR